MKFTWSNFKKAKAVRTIHSRVAVDLPLLGIEGVKAKVDTGAYSGALHAANIKEVQSMDGVKHLQFSPLGSPDHVVEIDAYHKRRVKSSNGVSAVRYAIDTKVTLAGKTYPITLTLTDRSFMRHEMLIGRNFLRIHGFLVDVNLPGQ